VLGFVQKIAELTQPTGSISILLNTYAHFIPTMQDQAAQPARKNRSLGFAAKYAAQPARKNRSLGFAAIYAAQPARKNRSLGFAAIYAAQLMDEILTPVPGEFHPVST
jgi:hypothetical protein